MDKKVVILIAILAGLLVLPILLPTILLIIFLFLPLLFVLPINPFFLVGLAIVISYVIKRARKRRKVELEERLENLEEGAIEEARLFRELTSEERDYLRNRSKKLEMVKQNAWWLAPLFLLTDSLLVWRFIIRLLDSIRFGVSPVFYNSNQNFTVINKEEIFIYLSLAWVLIFAQLYLLRWYREENRNYLDLRSPVFRIQGKALKETKRRKNRIILGPYIFITVRKITFSNVEHPNMENFFGSIIEGDEVAVEYSPRTKHVWKMYKTEDLK